MRVVISSTFGFNEATWQFLVGGFRQPGLDDHLGTPEPCGDETSIHRTKCGEYLLLRRMPSTITARSAVKNDIPSRKARVATVLMG